MNMISDVIAAISEVVEGLGQEVKTVYVQPVSDDRYRIGLKSTLWLRVGDVLTVGGTVAAVGCGYIEVTSDTEPGATISTAPVYFMHGTIKQVNQEMWGMKDARNFTPLVYYVEATRSRLNLDVTEANDHVNYARMLVLKSCDNKSWLNDDHYTNVLEVTEDIIEALIEGFRRSTKIQMLKGEAAISNYVNVGSNSEKGPEKNMFTYYFSGTEIRMDIPLHQQTCECN